MKFVSKTNGERSIEFVFFFIGVLQPSNNGILLFPRGLAGIAPFCCWFYSKKLGRWQIASAISYSAWGAYHHPAFLGNCPTISPTCPPYLPSRLVHLFLPGCCVNSTFYLLWFWGYSREWGHTVSAKFPCVTSGLENFSWCLPRAGLCNLVCVECL